MIIIPSSESEGAGRPGSSVSFSEPGPRAHPTAESVLGAGGAGEAAGAGGGKVRNFKRSQHHFSPRSSRRSIAGVRQLRRLANLAYLLDQAAERDQDESGQVDFVDLVSSRRSVFTELFQFDDKMSAWNEFVDSSEEEQQRILGRGSLGGRAMHSDDDDLGDFEELTLAGLTMTSAGAPKPPQGCPASPSAPPLSGSRLGRDPQTAAECFQRIDHKLRGFLRRRQYPRGELLRLEAELVTFFTDWPSSVYVTQLADGFRRLLLHAVSQYLDLRSTSFDGEGGRRHTQVEKRGGGGARAAETGGFMAPVVPLAVYLGEARAGVGGVGEQ